MTNYRCYLLDKNQRLIEVQNISAAEDAEAVGAARKFALERGAASFEIWQGLRQVDTGAAKGA
jgi:hypothetical protein